MIIYREQKTSTNPDEYLARIRSALRDFERGGFSEHALSVEILVDIGEFETAVVDALSPSEDTDDLIRQLFRGTGIDSGRLFRRSWEGITDGQEELTGRLHIALDRIQSAPLPHILSIGMPEGYVYYGLYPETYLMAALRFRHEIGPRRVVCIGLRNIGTSLSSVVAAVLEDSGCEVHSFTVRPRGFPFDRHLSLSGLLQKRIAGLSDAHVVIADEGPGLSGSSFGCTARTVSDLGFPDERIVFFPSWEPDRPGFASESTLDHWKRHPKYSTDFDAVCLGSEKLFGAPQGEFIDLSAGKWRNLFYSDSSDYPAVFPQHERRKFLSHHGFIRTVTGWRADVDPHGGSHGAPRHSGCFLKFAGLGRYGRTTCRIAEMLAEEGFSPPVIGLRNGFLVTRFLPGRPLSGRERDQKLLDTMARYLAFFPKAFPTGNGTSFDQVLEMVRENVLESMGGWWTRRLDQLASLYSAVEPGAATALDGRMFPHEWIHVSGMYYKTDGADHYNDHFFPGRLDVAWDIVGTSIEFGLDLSEREYLIDRYIGFSGDRTIRERLPFYRIVYPAYRLGYATEAADALYATPDGTRFRVMAERYRSLLRSEIAYLADRESVTVGFPSSRMEYAPLFETKIHAPDV